MSEFLEYVLYLLQKSLILALLTGALAAAVLGIIFVVHWRKYDVTSPDGSYLDRIMIPAMQ